MTVPVIRAKVRNIAATNILKDIVIFSTIEFLRPKHYCSPRQRLGSFHDGGYVVNDLVLSRRLYTFGVGDETSFEVDFIKREGAVAHLYDHTVNLNVPEIFGERMVFHKKALALKRTPHGDTVRGYIEANGDTNENITVKIDVEGFELDYFLNPLDSFISDSVVGLIVEFHIYNSGDKEKLIRCLKNISKSFTTYHIHGNNWVLETFDLEGKQCPVVFEVGFVTKGYADGQLTTEERYPIQDLDYPCKPGCPDIDLNGLLWG